MQTLILTIFLKGNNIRLNISRKNHFEHCVRICVYVSYKGSAEYDLHFLTDVFDLHAEYFQIKKNIDI